MLTASDLETTRTWLAIIAIASLIQLIGLLAMGWMGYRLSRRTSRRIAQLREQHIDPLVMHTETVVAEARDVGERLQRAKSTAKYAVKQTADSTRVALQLARYRVIPAWAVMRALRTVIRRRRA